VENKSCRTLNHTLRSNQIYQALSHIFLSRSHFSPFVVDGVD
jgi:hypothetical protein